jgi:hypothetical protein
MRFLKQTTYPELLIPVKWRKMRTHLCICTQIRFNYISFVVVFFTTSSYNSVVDEEVKPILLNNNISYDSNIQ